MCWIDSFQQLEMLWAPQYDLGTWSMSVAAIFVQTQTQKGEKYFCQTNALVELTEALTLQKDSFFWPTVVPVWSRNLWYLETGFRRCSFSQASDWLCDKGKVIRSRNTIKFKDPKTLDRSDRTFSWDLCYGVSRNLRLSNEMHVRNLLMLGRSRGKQGTQHRRRNKRNCSVVKLRRE